MTRKKQRLSLYDQQALDVILDRAARTHVPVTHVASAASPSRLNAVHKILSLLNELPPIEPPKNLVAKTISRVNGVGNKSTAHHSLRSAPSTAHLH